MHNIEIAQHILTTAQINKSRATNKNNNHTRFTEYYFRSKIFFWNLTMVTEEDIAKSCSKEVVD